MTTTVFQAESHESDSSGALIRYRTSYDQANGTGFQTICQGIGNGNDESASGYLHLFNPSGTTFVKHFMSRMSIYENSDWNENHFIAGYFNVTGAIDDIQFKMDSGNIDLGDICLYGISS